MTTSLDLFIPACINGDIGMVRECIASCLGHLKYALLCACRGGHADIAKLLIENGANNLSEALLAVCERSSVNHTAMAKLLLQHGAQITDKTMLNAMWVGNTDLYLVLITHGGILHADTPLNHKHRIETRLQMMA